MASERRHSNWAKAENTSLAQSLSIREVTDLDLLYHQMKADDKLHLLHQTVGDASKSSERKVIRHDNLAPANLDLDDCRYGPMVWLYGPWLTREG